MTKKNILLILLLVAIAVGWRIVNHEYMFAPNLELITTASVIAAITIGMRAAVIVPILSMIISDSIIGNTSIFIFTWMSFIVIGLSAVLLKKFNNKPKSQIIYSVGFAVMSSFLFFIITNFGVWLQGWYPATIEGLITDYVSAIPFYRTMLIGNIIMVPVAVAAWQAFKSRQVAKESVVDSLVRN